MKIITSNLIKFMFSALIATILFRWLLSESIETKNIAFVLLVAFAYGIGMFFLGWHFGKKDWEHLPIYDIGFRFHFTTYIVHNIVSTLWFLFKMNALFEKAHTFYFILIVWSFILVIHLVIYKFLKKNAINDLDKTDLFD